MENINNSTLMERNDILLNTSDVYHKVLTVMFEVTKKRYYFEVLNDLEFSKNEKVIVETVRGKELGISCGPVSSMQEKDLIMPLKSVVKKANENEIKAYLFLQEEAKKADLICREKIKDHNLNMKLVGTEYTYDRSKLVFYFSSEGRIDFRELVKDLAGLFRTRIELRQIGVRDEARILGTMGRCGKELCCKSFINKFSPVSIKMARDQSLVINPTKISGVCGRLLCCISYEYNQYEEALSKFPAVNQIVKIEEDYGRVVSINPLNNFLYIDVQGQGISKFSLEDIVFDEKEANKLKNMRTREEFENKKLEKE